LIRWRQFASTVKIRGVDLEEPRVLNPIGNHTSDRRVQGKAVPSGGKGETGNPHVDALSVGRYSGMDIVHPIAVQTENSVTVVAIDADRDR
jgi:hypothetical protein